MHVKFSTYFNTIHRRRKYMSSESRVTTRCPQIRTSSHAAGDIVSGVVRQTLSPTQQEHFDSDRFPQPVSVVPMGQTPVLPLSKALNRTPADTLQNTPTSSLEKRLLLNDAVIPLTTREPDEKHTDDSIACAEETASEHCNKKNTFAGDRGSKTHHTSESPRCGTGNVSKKGEKNVSLGVKWAGTDVLDALLMFGTTHSPVCFSGWMGLMRLLVDMVVSSYRVRDLDPRVADTIELAFSTADPIMALGIVLLFLPSAPQTCELLLQYSVVCDDTVEFIEFLEKASSQFLRNETKKAPGSVFALHPEHPTSLLFPTIQSYTMACRSAWVNR